MTRIEFHFNAPERLTYTCRLLRKIHASQLRTGVVGTLPLLRHLDEALWTFSALDFIPHRLLGPGGNAEGKLAETVILSDNVKSLGAVDVLINLGEAVPAGFESMTRMIEIVTSDDLDRAQARTRWKHYAQMGYELVRHDLAKPAGL
jgi:DNA polymerase III subunit chi